MGVSAVWLRGHTPLGWFGVPFASRGFSFLGSLIFLKELVFLMWPAFPVDGVFRGRENVPRLAAPFGVLQAPGALWFLMFAGIARRGKREHGAQIKTDSPKRARDVFSPKVNPL